MYCTSRIFYISLVMLNMVFTGISDQNIFAQQPEQASETRGFRELLEEIEPLVVELRGLPFLETIDKAVQTPDELQQVLRRELDRTYPGEALQVLEKRLLQFGFIVSPLNLEKMFMQLYSQQIAGYYDPLEEKMVLVQGAPASGSQGIMLPVELWSKLMLESMGSSLYEIIIAHELTHVMQDQHFELMSLPVEELAQEDLSAAARALIEGDATLVMMDYMLQQQQPGMDATQVPGIAESMRSWANNPLVKGFGLFQTVPRYIMDNLLFSYLYGFDFVLQLKRRGGWEAINTAYTDVPASTEQILHPEKYFEQRDDPTAITLPAVAALSPHWKELERNTLGEFNIHLLIDGFLPASWAWSAAEGWDGDRFVFFEDTQHGEFGLVWYTTWDSEQDAREFFYTYRQTLEKRYQKQNPPPVREMPETQTLWTLDAHDVVIEQRGHDVLVLDGIPHTLRRQARNLFWTSEKQPFQDAKSSSR